MDRDSDPEKVGRLKATCKEEDASSSDVEGHPEQPFVSATEQRSVPGSGRPLWTELMEQISVDAFNKGIIQPCYVLIEALPIPLPVVVPEKSAGLPSGKTAIQPQNDYVTGVENPVEKMQFADGTCNEDSMDMCCQAETSTPAQNTGNAQDAQPPPLAAPTKKRKRYICAWCKEPFKLQINLEVHYRYCRQKKKQPRLLLKALKAPSEPDESESSSTGDSGDSVLSPEKSAQDTSSNDGEEASDSKLWQLLQKQRVAKYKYMFNARKSTTERVRKLAATTCAMKKLWRCLECEEKFVYKWQFMAHLERCKENVPGENQLSPEPQGLAAREVSDSDETEEPSIAPAVRPSTSKDSTLYLGDAKSPEPKGLAARRISDSDETEEPSVAPAVRPSTSKDSTLYLGDAKSPEPQGLAARRVSDSDKTQEPSVAPAVRPSTSKGSTLYQCDKCGKNLSKCYIPTHCAFHMGQRSQCMWCGKILNFRSTAMRHKKQYYRYEETINCPNCGKSASYNCFCTIRKVAVAPDSDDGKQSKPEEPK